MVEVLWAARTDVGGRSHNEDAWFGSDDLFAVADGMGGHQAGELAARLAVDALEPLTSLPRLTAERLVETIIGADRTITAEGRRYLPLGIGTTLTGIALLTGAGGPMAVVFNVGDSRVYRWQDGSLERLTHDHSLVQRLIDDGEITPAQARTHPRRNIITRSLGSGTAETDLDAFDVIAGDRFLLCSDGLTEVLDDDELAGLLDPANQSEPGACADALVAAALGAETDDNVTVLVVDVVSAGGDGEVRHGNRELATRPIYVDDARTTEQMPVLDDDDQGERDDQREVKGEGESDTAD